MLRLHLMAPFHFESDSWVRKLHLGQCLNISLLSHFPLVDRRQPLGEPLAIQKTTVSGKLTHIYLSRYATVNLKALSY